MFLERKNMEDTKEDNILVIKESFEGLFKKSIPGNIVFDEEVFNKKSKSLIKSYLVWENRDLLEVFVLDVSSVKRVVLEDIIVNHYIYAEVKANTEQEARSIFSQYYDFLDMDKLKDSQAYLLKKSFMSIEKRFYC